MRISALNLAAVGITLLGPRIGEFGAEKNDLRGVVHPNEYDHDGGSRAVS